MAEKFIFSGLSLIIFHFHFDKVIEFGSLAFYKKSTFFELLHKYIYINAFGRKLLPNLKSFFLKIAYFCNQ